MANSTPVDQQPQAFSLGALSYIAQNSAEINFVAAQLGVSPVDVAAGIARESTRLNYPSDLADHYLEDQGVDIDASLQSSITGITSNEAWQIFYDEGEPGNRF